MFSFFRLSVLICLAAIAFEGHAGQPRTIRVSGIPIEMPSPGWLLASWNPEEHLPAGFENGPARSQSIDFVAIVPNQPDKVWGIFRVTVIRNASAQSMDWSADLCMARLVAAELSMGKTQEQLKGIRYQHCITDRPPNKYTSNWFNDSQKLRDEGRLAEVAKRSGLSISSEYVAFVAASSPIGDRGRMAVEGFFAVHEKMQEKDLLADTGPVRDYGAAISKSVRNVIEFERAAFVWPEPSVGSKK